MLIFFYGEDAFRSGEKVSEIKSKFLNNDKPSTGLSLFDAAETKTGALTALHGALSSPGLFSAKRLLILKRIMSQVASDEQSAVLKLLKQEKDNLTGSPDVVLVFWEEGTPRKNNALFKFLLENAKKQSFDKLSGLKLEQWTLKRLKGIDARASIARDALGKLLVYTDGDTATLASEIGKLAAYADGEMISGNMVDSLVQADLDNNIFATIEALSANNKSLAVELLHRHLEKGDDPFYLLSMFVYQFRNLLRIASLQDTGVHGEMELAKLSKLHPYVVKKSLRQATNFGSKKLRAIYRRLGDIDTKIKTGQLEIKLALDKFIVEL